MARSITWAIRVTLADQRVVFLRRGGSIGSGPIATYPTQTSAEADAIVVWQRHTGVLGVAVIERSHGRQRVESQAVAKDGR